MNDDRYKPLVPGKDVPRNSLLHPEFRYTPSEHSDIRARFAQVREEIERAAASAPTPFRKRKAVA